MSDILPYLDKFIIHSKIRGMLLVIAYMPLEIEKQM